MKKNKYKPSLWLRCVGALIVLLGAVAVWLSAPPILRFDLATMKANTPAVNIVNAGLLGLLLLSQILDRFRVSASTASIVLSPFVGVAVAGLTQLT